MDGGDTQKTVASNQPMKTAQPLYDKAFKDAQTLYKGPGLVQANTMNTVVPYASQTTQGMDLIQNQANAAMQPGGFASQFQDIINNGGYNSQQMDAVNNTRSLANSSYDMNANPGFQGVLDSVLQKAGTGVNQNAAAMGRYGSGAHTDVMTRTQGDIANEMISDDYNRFLGRRDAANNQLFGMGQQGMDNLNPAYASMQTPAQDLMGVGSMYEDQAGRVLNDQLRIAQEKQNLPLNNIMALINVANGAGSYGTQTQSAQGPNSMFSNVAGGLLGGASLLNAMRPV